ncbi:hypothetical protein TNCV_3243411 [Trichonephila clavipes]|nr:hypothetical protein TNCV_3243411 [Trichonephila clavipes]
MSHKCSTGFKYDENTGSNCQAQTALIRYCNPGATNAVTSIQITIILESLPNPGDDTFDYSKFLGYLSGYAHIPNGL